MRKILLCSATYKENEPMFEVFHNKIKPRFERYCEYHGFELIILDRNYAPNGRTIGWSKLFWIKDNAELQNGDVVCGIGADCCLINCKEPMIFDAEFAVPMESTGVLCMDFYSIRISDWSRRFLNELCSDQRLQLTKGTGEEIWHENGIIFQILGIPFGGDENGFGQREGCPFTREELIANVKILPTKWNVTYNPDDVDWSKNNFSLGDQNDPDYIYKIISQYYRPEKYCLLKDTVIRHLSSQTVMSNWAERYFNEPLIF